MGLEIIFGLIFIPAMYRSFKHEAFFNNKAIIERLKDEGPSQREPAENIESLKDGADQLRVTLIQ